MLSLRDSRALNRHTQEIAIIARNSERSGNEMQEMTKRMEKDARLMKFLAEVTAFFLPLTAVAVSLHRLNNADSGLPNDAASQFLAWTSFLSRKLRKELYQALTSSSTPGCTGRLQYQSRHLSV